MYDDASIAIAVGFLGKGRFKLIGLSWAAPKGGGVRGAGEQLPPCPCPSQLPTKKIDGEHSARCMGTLSC